MNRKWIWIALLAFLLPIAARAIWYFPGYSTRPKVETPNYADMRMPAAPVQSPQAETTVSQRGGVVVFDTIHANQFKQNEMQALSESLKARGARTEFDAEAGLLETRLKYASAYVIAAPNMLFTTDEIRVISAFVQRGGRLVVFTDATRGLLSYDFFTGSETMYSDSDTVNPLLASFGISVNNDYLYNIVQNEGNFRNVFFDQFGKNELDFGLKQVAFYGTHSVKTDSGLILLSSGDQTLSSQTDAHDPSAGGAALSADGNVLVFGDFTFLTTPYNEVADNATLIANIADFMLGGTRKQTLANFPYIFNGQSVQVLPTSEVQITAEMIASLGRMQTSLQMLNVQMKITDKVPAEGDMLILGTFTQTEDLLPLIEPFGLVVDDFAPYIEVPGFGKVGRTGNGILIFEPGKRGNTLILLADTNDDLTYLLDALSAGGLYGCLLQGEVGVCSIGFGGSFSEEPTLEAPPTEIPVGEPTPAPTPVG